MVQTVTAETVKLKVRPLSAEAFHPYGQVLERGQLLYPEVEEGRVAMELLRTRHRPDGRHTAQLAVHFTYNQTFIPVQGSMILIVAPPPMDREADPRLRKRPLVHARLLGTIPITPGGIGVVELSLTATLIGFGGSNAGVVAAVLVYRFLTMVPTIVIGLAATPYLNRRARRETVSVEAKP